MGRREEWDKAMKRLDALNKLNRELREVIRDREHVSADGLHEDGTLVVTVREPDGVGITHAELKALSELLGTDLIDLGTEYETEGCETCDYGWAHECTITCREVTR